MKDFPAYKQWLTALKARIKQSQIKAAISVNTEMILLYWDLGRQIVDKQQNAQWGSGFIEQLSEDLKNEFPNISGFSTDNLWFMKRMYLFYNQEDTNLAQAVQQLTKINKTIPVHNIAQVVRCIFININKLFFCACDK